MFQKKINNKIFPKKVLVGLSGGVDSAVSAYLLKQQGYEVYGCFIKTWQPEWMECTWRDERRDAMRAAAHLGISFFELDMEREYRDDVAMYMIREYEQGRTPNPDVMCNKYVKFSGLKKLADQLGCHYIATGHYAKIVEKENNFFLSKGRDPLKDQSYFLYQIPKEILSRLIFPLGDLLKTETRNIAETANLPQKLKKDSQGICFLGHVDMIEFLSHYIEQKEGNVLNESNEIIGRHRGSIFYTIGERKGFTITEKNIDDLPYYVVSKDREHNTITVTHKKQEERKDDNSLYTLSHVNELSLFSVNDTFDVLIRYHGKPIKSTIKEYSKESDILKVLLHESDYSIASGQSMVFYEKETCLGGGIVV